MKFDRNILISFVNGELSPEQCAEVIAWAKESPENYEMLERERRLVDLVNLAPDNSFPQSKVRRLSFVWKAAGIAAGIAAILSFALFIKAPKGAQNILAETVVSAPAGSRSMVTLPDGSEVWLNSGSSIKYLPVRSKDGKREVELDGQARFDVVKDTDHPFVVHTYVADIEVLGTTFDVIADKERDTFETALFTGKVKLSSPLWDGKTIYLSPDQKLSFNGSKYQVSAVVDYDTYQWIDGLYCFNAKPFSQIIEDMEKYFNTDIECNVGPELASETLTGKFRINDGLDFALRALQISLDFKYRFGEGNETVIISE